MDAVSLPGEHHEEVWMWPMHFLFLQHLNKGPCKMRGINTEQSLEGLSAFLIQKTTHAYAQGKNKGLQAHLRLVTVLYKECELNGY